MSRLDNNNGIALVTALLFTLICLGIVMALLTIITQGTRVSAARKTYSTAREASYGAVDLLSRDILPAIFNSTFDATYKGNLESSLNMTFNNVNFPMSTLDVCFNQKVGSSTALWTACAGTPTTPEPKQSPDVTFNLKAMGDPAGFNVYAKIVDTKCGGDTAAGQPCTNSDTSGTDYLDTGGGVASSIGTVTPQHRPVYYRIEVQSERAVNPREKARLSVLYAY